MGPGGPVSTGRAGGEPLPGAPGRPVRRCWCPTAVQGRPRAPWPRGWSILHGPQVALRVLGAPAAVPSDLPSVTLPPPPPPPPPVAPAPGGSPVPTLPGPLLLVFRVFLLLTPNGFPGTAPAACLRDALSCHCISSLVLTAPLSPGCPLSFPPSPETELAPGGPVGPPQFCDSLCGSHAPWQGSTLPRAPGPPCLAEGGLDGSRKGAAPASSPAARRRPRSSATATVSAPPGSLEPGLQPCCSNAKLAGESPLSRPRRRDLLSAPSPSPFPGEGPAQQALQSLSRRLQVQEKEMELVKAALAEALRLLRLQAPASSLQDPPSSLQDPGLTAPTRARYACRHPSSSSFPGPQRASG